MKKKSISASWLSDERYGAINQRCIRPISVSKLGAIVLNGMHISIVFTIWISLMSMFSLVMSIMFTEYDSFYEEVIGFSIFPAFPLSLWLICKLLYTLLPIKHGIGSPWELNRQTGLVSTYNKKKPKEPPQINTAPFAEMDAFMARKLDRFGFTFTLVIAHRYSSMTVPVGDLIGDTSALENCEMLWDFIQNYMDISKPLPDITLFEDCRSKDPTTAAYDQQTNRNPRYWIDMDDKQWQHQLKTNPLLNPHS